MKESIQYPRFRWLILISAVLGYISLQITNLSFAPILPQIAEDLGVDMGAATNLMTAFLFSGCISLLFAGAICDRYGIMAGVVLGLLCAAAPAVLMPWIGTNYMAVFWARIVEGLSMGFLYSAMGPIIALWFPLNQKGLASGLMGASVSVGSAVGVMAGPTVFLATGSWRHMSAWLSIVGWIGVIFALILLLSPKPQLPSQSQPSGESISDGAVFKRALLSPMTWIGIVVTFFAAWCLQCLYGLTPSFLSADKPVGAGFGPMMSGQLMLVVMIAGIIGPIICGVLTDKVFRGNTKPVMLIGFVLCCIFIYAIQTPFVYVNVPFLIVALALAGLGIQLVCPLLFVYVAKVYSIQIVGKMTGLWMGIGTFGGAAGLFLGGLTVNMYGNYNVAITLIALAAAAGFIFALFMVRPKH